MKIADPNPARCSVCFQAPSVHDPQLPHVDFEVAWDGPVITRHGDEIAPQNSTPLPIDDLYVCADCLASAARLIGMENGEQARAEIARLREQVAAMELEVADKDKWISNLEKSVGYAIDHPVKRPHGKPRIDGPESHQDGIDELRQNKVAEERRAKARREKETV